VEQNQRVAAEGEGVLLLQPSLDRLLQLWWQPHWRLLRGGKLRVLVRMLAGLRLQASADRQAGRHYKVYASKWISSAAGMYRHST
jgi:hypothetical protein